MFKKALKAILSKNLSSKELTDEKIKDFKRLTFIQGCLILTLFNLNLFVFLDFPYHIPIAESIFFLFLGIYVFLLWDMLRNYTSDRRIIIVNLIFIMGVFLVGVIVVNPFIPMEVTPTYKVLLVVIMLSLLIVESTVIYYTLAEFFRKDLGMPLRLWGAACIYLMIGIAFGSAYEIICIMDIQCLGEGIPLQTIGFMKRVEYSLTVISGMSSPFENPTGMIFSLGTIEALWSQIFIVLIVGRLLMK